MSAQCQQQQKQENPSTFTKHGHKAYSSSLPVIPLTFRSSCSSCPGRCESSLRQQSKDTLSHSSSSSEERVNLSTFRPLRRSQITFLSSSNLTSHFTSSRSALFITHWSNFVSLSSSNSLLLIPSPRLHQERPTDLLIHSFRHLSIWLLH